MKNISLVITVMLLIENSWAQQLQRQQQQQITQQQQQEQSADTEYLQSPEYLETLQQEFQVRAANQAARDTQATQEHASHERICPTCFGLSTECSVDQGRLSHGIVLLCGCNTCGGNGYN